MLRRQSSVRSRATSKDWKTLLDEYVRCSLRSKTSRSTCGEKTTGLLMSSDFHR